MEFFTDYGLFLAKAITFILTVAITLILVLGLLSKQKSKKGELELIDLSKQLKNTKKSIEEQLLTPQQLKERLKAEKKQTKAKNKEQKKAAKNGELNDALPQLYVVDFKGSIDAKEVALGDVRSTLEKVGVSNPRVEDRGVSQTERRPRGRGVSVVDERRAKRRHIRSSKRDDVRYIPKTNVRLRRV